jgi:hypothetical protein
MKLDIHKAFDIVNWSYLATGSFVGSGLWTTSAGVSVHPIPHGHFECCLMVNKGQVSVMVEVYAKATPIALALHLGHGPSTTSAKYGKPAWAPHPSTHVCS